MLKTRPAGVSTQAPALQQAEPQLTSSLARPQPATFLPRCAREDAARPTPTKVSRFLRILLVRCSAALQQQRACLRSWRAQQAAAHLRLRQELAPCELQLDLLHERRLLSSLRAAGGWLRNGLSAPSASQLGGRTVKGRVEIGP